MARGLGKGTYHPLDPLEVLLEMLIAVAVAICNGDAAVVRAQHCRHAKWQAPRQLSLQWYDQMTRQGLRSWLK